MAKNEVEVKEESNVIAFDQMLLMLRVRKLE